MSRMKEVYACLTETIDEQQDVTIFILKYKQLTGIELPIETAQQYYDKEQENAQILGSSNTD